MLALAGNRGALARIEIKMDGNTEICAAPSPIPSMSKHLAERFDRKFAAGDPVAVGIAEHLGIGRDQTEPETPNKEEQGGTFRSASVAMPIDTLRIADAEQSGMQRSFD